MRIYFALVAILLIVFGGLVLSGASSAVEITKEGGLIEGLTVVIYAVSLVVLLWQRPMKWMSGNFLTALLVLFLMLRELDFDKAFTTMGIFKSRFYKSTEVPLMEKLVVIIILLGLLYAVYALFSHYRKSLFANIRDRERAEWGVLTVFCLAFFSKVILDGMPRKLTEIGLKAPPEAIDKWHGVLEEILELGIPISVLLAIWFTRQRKHQR